MRDCALTKGLARLAGLALLAGAGAWGQSVTVTATPGNVNLTYVQGATLPGAQSISLKASASGATFTASVSPNVPWLTVAPMSGTLPGKVSLFVNPTSLPAGTYPVTVTFSPAAATPPGTAGVTNLKLTVIEPPSVVTISPASLTFSNPPAPAPQNVQLSTSSGAVSFTAVSSAPWLTFTPASGIVLPGGPVTLTVTADPSALGPAVTAYSAKITLTETGSTSKTQSIPATFAVDYQKPTVAGIWPPTGKAGGPATTVTISGANFGASTVAKIQGATPVSLKTTYLTPTVIDAVIPAAQLAAGNTLTIYATNPAPGGDSTTTVDFTFTPTIDSAVNSASYAAGGAPGAIITLFGENIGPTTAASLADANGDGYVDTTLGGVGVKVDNVDAPLVYVSQHQISLQVPYEVNPGTGKTIVVSNGGNPSANGTIDITATSPGIFTLDGSGSGQAAALNTSAATGAVTLNSTANAAHIGDAISLYLTGEGVYTNTPTPVDGYIIPSGMLIGAMPQLSAGVTVTIGGQPAPVTYAGAFDGGMLGALQVNATVPSHATSAAAPVVVTIGGQTTQAGVTIVTKP